MKWCFEAKPKQEVKSFLSNFENLLSQHKSKFWKREKLDLVEDNYDWFVIFVVTEMYNQKLFMCQFFEYVIEQQFSTIEQIRESIIVRGGWEDQNDTEENSNKIQRKYYSAYRK